VVFKRPANFTSVKRDLNFQLSAISRNGLRILLRFHRNGQVSFFAVLLLTGWIVLTDVS